jgi:RNA polymerase sigma factor (sigma-70 family)
MHASTLHGVLDCLRKLTDPTRPHELSDTELLERFRLRREEAAFTLLVQRHGPMVLNICRRILGDVHQAEDAFQATFLVLVRKAGTIRKQQSLAGWLHRVASHLALRTRAQTARRQTYEREFVAPARRDDSCEALAAAELRAALDEEIERLPDKYRMPLVLCYLADKTHEQAAGELGWPKSSVTARLARARELLQRRLRHRGFIVPAGLLATLLTEHTANAALPSLLTLSTVRLAMQALAGETLAAASAAVLAGGFVKSTVALKLRAMLVLLAMLGFAAVGYRMAIPGSSSPAEQPASKTPGRSEPRAAKSELRQPRLDLFGDPLPEEAVARLGSVRLRHPGIGRRSFFFSPDGKQIVSSTNESLWISDAATGKLLRRFDFGFDQVSIQTSCRYVGDSIICAGMSAERIVAVQTIDAATGQLRRCLRIKEATGAFNQALSLDGKRLAWPRRDEIRLYDTATGEMVQRISHKGIPGWSIAFAPDGKSIALNDLSDTIYFYDTANGKRIRELKRPGDSRPQIVFSPDGRFLASMPQRPPAEKGEVSIWSVKDGKEVHRWTHPFSIGMSATFSPDGKRVAIGDSRWGLVRWGLVLWDLETGKEVRRFSPPGGAAHSAFSPDGKVLATSSPRGAIRLWDAATGKLFSAPEPDVDSFPFLRFSSDSKRVFSGGGVCLVWDAATGRELKCFTDPQPLDLKSLTDLRILALSPDESLLAISRPREKISLRDAATGKEKQTLPGDDPTWRLLFAPDGRRLISTGNKDVVHVWDVASGRELHHMPGRFQLAISRDGRLLAASDRQMTVFVYDLTTGQETKRFAFPQAGLAGGSAILSDLAFAPDGSSLAAVGTLRTPTQRGIIRLWDLTDGGRVRSFDSQKAWIDSVAFSPDGRSLATGDREGELILWEVRSGRPRHVFAGHECQIISLAFSPDGRSLAASSAGGPVYVWDVAGSLQSKPRRLANDELQRGWSALGSEDASAAFQAIRRLAAVPEQTLPFLREHLKPVPAPDEKRLRQLVDMLDNADFSTRQKAVEELEKQNDAAAGLLRQIVAKEKPSLEVRRRLQPIVESIENKPESLRALRAVEVLERIATPDAVRFLGELAGGAADARLTREAAAAKRRLQ